MLDTIDRSSGPSTHRLRFVLGFALTAAIAIPSRAAADTAALSIDVSRPGAKIDRNLFGQFAEPLGRGV